jgi:hypothetical protein
MLYPLLIGIFFLMQQGLQGASADLPEPDTEGTKLTIAKAQKKLQELFVQWFLHNQTFPSKKPKRFSLPLSTNSAPKRTSKPSANDLLLLDLAKRYKALREEFPQLPESEDIEFFYSIVCQMAL